MLAITKEHLTLDAPMVVDEVGIIEVDAPAFALWREAAQEQHLGILRQKRDERMPLHPVFTTGDILLVQIRKNILFTLFFLILNY